MCRYTTFEVKVVLCAHTDSLNRIISCGVYSHYYTPYIFTRWPPPPSAGQTVVGCSPPIFFWIFLFFIYSSLNLLDIIMPTRKIFFIFFYNLTLNNIINSPCLKLRWEILSAWNTIILVILDYKFLARFIYAHSNFRIKTRSIFYKLWLEIFTRNFA